MCVSRWSVSISTIVFIAIVAAAASVVFRSHVPAPSTWVTLGGKCVRPRGCQGEGKEHLARSNIMI